MNYGGEFIFGDVAKLIGPPQQQNRAMRRSLPGVDGYRVYRLGRGGRTLRIRGRLNGATATELALKIYAAGQMVDGQLRTLVTDGETLVNVELEAYVPGPIQKVVGSSTVAYSCVVDATLTQAAPP